MVAHGEGWGKRIRIIRIIISTNNNQLSLKALFQLFIFVSNSFAEANLFGPWFHFVSTQQKKCRHFFVFATPKFGFSLTYLYLCNP